MFYSLLVFPVFFFCSTATTTAQSETFTNSASEPHYVLITMTKQAVDIPDVRAEVTKYIWKNHPADKLNISHILIGENRSVNAMFLKEFRNKAHAMSFYKKMMDTKPDFMQMNLTKDYYAISKSNFDQMLRNRTGKG